MSTDILAQFKQLLLRNDLSGAIALLESHCQNEPADIDARMQLGMAYGRAGKLDKAASCFRSVLEMDPHEAHALFNLGRVFVLAGRISEAVQYYRRALQVKPDFAEALSTLGKIMRDQGDNVAAARLFMQAELLPPDFRNPRIHLQRETITDQDLVVRVAQFQMMMGSNRLFLDSYNVLSSPQAMLAESRRWDEVHGAAGRAGQYTHARHPAAAGRRLRIGYVSPDFRAHSVSYFFEPLLAAHDRERVEVICYAEVAQPDAMTERLQALADSWVSTVGMSDAEVAARIQADGIDILVDLAGHTTRSRLGVFTYKPAPIQATYLGYFTTTGLAAMDYWLSDEVLTPLDTVEQSSETIIRLPRCCLTYTAPSAAPAVIERPSGQPLVFGSFNDLSKAGPGSVETWSEILRRVPESRLLLKAKTLGDTGQRELWLQRFEAEGIERERIELRDRTKGTQEHLALYGEVDIALDTMPRTGGTTTAEALWMGVPVISLAGERFIERLSASMLQAVGLEDLIVHSKEDYVARALALAAEGPRSQALRASLREQMAVSPLCDATGLAQAMEQAYRDMWRQWCGGG